jgi:hypothetical protein
MRRVALVVASLLAIAPSADAKCARQGLTVEVLPDASGGAIVMHSTTHVESKWGKDVTTWTLRVDGDNVEPVIEVLAPGLSVYRLPRGAKVGELVDGTTTLAKVTAVTAKPLPAPKVKAVQHQLPVHRGKRGSTRTTVAITGSVPTDAVAIVITDAKGTPLSYGQITAGEPLEPYFHQRCGVLPNGTIEPTVGVAVRLFWVDKYGQASAKSAAIKVVKAP